MQFKIQFSNYSSLLVVVATLMSGCSSRVVETGNASYYADKFEGRKTASGEVFRQNKMTAAHKTLPFGTRVKVINMSNGKRIKVRINDRGPFVQSRIIDLSKKAAGKLQITHRIIFFERMHCLEHH